MTFIFDEQKHQYFLDGQWIPSVTQIIKPLSGIEKIPSYILRPRAIRGTRIHKMVELYLQGILDESTLTDEFKRILEQFIIFLNKEGKDFDFESAFLEYGMYHKRLKFAGKPDIILDSQAIIDIKSSKFGSVTLPLQLIAYEKLWINDCGLKDKYKHYRLILDKDYYSFESVNVKGAWNRFRYLLDHHWNEVEFNKNINIWSNLK